MGEGIDEVVGNNGMIDLGALIVGCDRIDSTTVMKETGPAAKIGLPTSRRHPAQALVQAGGVHLWVGHDGRR